MDPITTAIVTALSAGAISGLTDTSKAAISDAYTQFKALLKQKFGASSEVVQAVSALEAHPDSTGRKETLQEEIIASNAQHDEELLAAANSLRTLIQPQQAGLGKFNVQNHATVQAQNVGDHNTITQNFGPS
jgi:hypothetical protein